MQRNGQPAKWFPQLLSFTLVGAIGTLLHYAVLVALVSLVDVKAVVASSIGALAGAVVNYLLNHVYTFRSNESHRRAAIKFAVVAAIGFAINAAIMFVLVELRNVHYLASQVIATGVVLLWNFLISRSWVFRRSVNADGT